MRRIKDWGLLCLCNAIWASQFVLVKLAQDEVGPVSLTALPLLAATLMLAPLTWRRRATRVRPAVSRRDAIAFVALGVFGQVVAQLFVTWGSTRAPASTAALLQLTLPVVTAVMAFALLRERMTAVRWAGLALALAGVLVVANPLGAGADGPAGAAAAGQPARGAALGGLLVFVGVLGSAFYNVFGKKLLGRYAPIELLQYSYGAACAVLVPLALALEPETLGRLATLSGRAWAGLGLLAVGQYWLSMVLFLRVLSRLDATQAALSNYLIPFFGVLIAAVTLGERLTVSAVAGGALVLLSTLAATLFEARPAAAAAGSRAAIRPPGGARA